MIQSIRLHKFVKYALALLLLSLLFILGAQETEAAYAMSGTVTADTLNVRSIPSVNGKYLRTASKNEHVIILDRINHWYKINYDGVIGYVSADFITPECNSEKQHGTGIITVNGVFLRYGAGTDTLAMYMMAEGDTVTITGIRDGWLRVKYENKELKIEASGYVHPDYVETIRPESLPAVLAARNIVSNGQQIVNIAKKYLGVPYVWGGITPKGFDCSGLVVYVFREWGGYTFKQRTRLYLDGMDVKRENLQPGDLVFFDTAGQGNITHVGIYVGNNQFLHAPRTGLNVSISSMAPGTFYYRTFRRANRIV